MNPTRQLHDSGQSLWLDNIARGLLRTGMLRRYVDEFSITGLTSNPTIFDHAIKTGGEYDDAIRRKLSEGKSGEELFVELALEDLTEAADLFRPIYERPDGVDGWASLEVSPKVAWQRLANLGARPHRLLWASTGTKDPHASDILYVAALAASHTINTIPETTLHAFSEHGRIGTPLPRDGGDAEEVLEELVRAGVDYAGLGAQLQTDGTRVFNDSWDDLLDCLSAKAAAFGAVH